MNKSKEATRNKITEEEIVKLKESGLTYREIGNMFGVTKQAIHRLAKRHLSEDEFIQLNDEIILLLKTDFDRSGLSLLKYANTLGTSKYILEKILSKSTKKIKRKHLKKIADYCNMTVDEFIDKLGVTNLKYLSPDIYHSKDLYKTIVYKNILNGSACTYKGQVVNSSLSISKEAAIMIKIYRLSNDLSLKEFSKIIGMSSSRISQLENFKVSKLKYSSLVKISHILNVSIEQLLATSKAINIDISSADFKIKLHKSTVHKIKRSRLKLKLTQEQLGNICGVKQEFISRIELGILKSIKESTFRNMCLALNLDYPSSY